LENSPGPPTFSQCTNDFNDYPVVGVETIVGVARPIVTINQLSGSGSLLLIVGVKVPPGRL